jgi:signal transduction histidine kinase
VAIAQMDDAVVLLRTGDSDGVHLVYANPAAERLAGAPAADAPNDWRKRAGLAENPEVAAMIEQAFARRQVARFDAEWRIHGAPSIFEVLMTPMRLKGEERANHWSLTARDVTTQRQASARTADQQRLESLRLLAGSIAHDLGNLVHVISGYADLACRHVAKQSAAAEAIRTVQQSTERAGALAKQLLSFSRRQHLVHQAVQPASLLHQILPVLERLAGPRVRVEYDIAPAAVSAVVWADRLQLEQVLMNLVVNARDAQPQGGRVALTLDVVVDRLALRNGPVLRLCVRDDGPGIPPELRGRVFEPFFTTRPSGSGLGLSTVHAIVRDSGGEITLHSPPDAGLVVEILLPVHDATGAAPPRP